MIIINQEGNYEIFMDYDSCKKYGGIVGVLSECGGA